MVSLNEATTNDSKRLLRVAPQGSQRVGSPSYTTLQAHPQSAPHAQPHSRLYEHNVAGHVAEERAGRRFLKAFTVAVLIWLLFVSLARSYIGVLHWNHRHRHGSWAKMAHDGIGGSLEDEYDYFIPPGLALHDCIQGEDWESASAEPLSTSAMTDFSGLRTGHTTPHAFASTTSFYLPLSSRTLLFLARGRLGGALRFTTSPLQAQDSARVLVTIRYDRPEIKDTTRACLLTRRADETGVGLFADVHPRFPGGGFTVSYEMTVVFPESQADSLVIENLETDMPNSSHVLEDVGIYFDSVSLRGSNGAIAAESLTATMAKIHTSNGEISGMFNTTKELVLETSNHPIRVLVGLRSDGTRSPLTFKARTSNGVLEADINLLTEFGSDGVFDVQTRTSNAPLRLTFPASPVDSKLTVDASTSNNNAAVSLNAAYEGRFHLRSSSPFLPSVRRSRRGREDPKGEGRERRVVYQALGKKEVDGDIYWDENPEGYGAVNVRTSNGAVVLEV